MRELARAGEAEWLVALGHWHEEGLRRSDGTVLVRRDLRAARRCFERAAAQDAPEGIAALANYLSRPGTRAADVRRALVLYRRAFALGYVTAGYNLGVTYRARGEYRLAYRWFERARAAGDPSALFEIARAQLYGVGTKRAPEAAVAKLVRVARSKTKYWPPATGEIVEAMILLARAHMDGWLGRRDFQAGRRWLKRAAAKGNATAQAMLDEGIVG
jgi:TPR repeat protein